MVNEITLMIQPMIKPKHFSFFPPLMRRRLSISMVVVIRSYDVNVFCQAKASRQRNLHRTGAKKSGFPLTICHERFARRDSTKGKYLASSYLRILLFSKLIRELTLGYGDCRRSRNRLLRVWLLLQSQPQNRHSYPCSI